METDATSVVKVNVKDQAPKLHYIYPTCFEAGRPMEFVACGSFLLQPNFRYDMMHFRRIILLNSLLVYVNSVTISVIFLGIMIKFMFYLITETLWLLARVIVVRCYSKII